MSDPDSGIYHVTTRVYIPYPPSHHQSGNQMSALRRPFLPLIPRSLLTLNRSCPNLLKVSTGKTAGENDNEVKTESDEAESNDRKEKKKEEGEEVETGEMTAAERKEHLSKFPYFRIEMSILNGRELIAMDRGGTSDPYVKVVQVSALEKLKQNRSYENFFQNCRVMRSFTGHQRRRRQ